MASQPHHLTIGTRGSALALWQAEHVQKLLHDEYVDYEITLKIIKTTGDKILDQPLNDIGGKGLFLKEIEDQILSGGVDLGVHSMKDVPGILDKGLEISAVLEREDPRDVLVSAKYSSLDKLPKGAKVGTSSLRRKAQLLAYRADLQIVPLRGNVDTRLRKLEEEGWAAIVLAAAGVHRLGLSQHITEYIPTHVMLPAVAQGAMGIEIRSADKATQKLVHVLDHAETSACIAAERAFLRMIEGDCRAPIAAYAQLKKGQIFLEALVARSNGLQTIRESVQGPREDAECLGANLAKKILAEGGKHILEQERCS